VTIRQQEPTIGEEGKCPGELFLYISLASSFILSLLHRFFLNLLSFGCRYHYPWLVSSEPFSLVFVSKRYNNIKIKIGLWALFSANRSISSLRPAPYCPVPSGLCRWSKQGQITHTSLMTVGRFMMDQGVLRSPIWATVIGDVSGTLLLKPILK
jgi:hypothetical protein